MTETRKINQCVIHLEIGDITDLDIEAFVFYARSDLDLGSGYGNAISMRGGPSIKKELAELGELAVGESIASGAGELKADYIIHAVGPKFQEEDTEKKLRDTVLSVLKTAEKRGIKKIAFPPMGTGFYGIPLPVCAKIMIGAFREYLNGNSGLEEIRICPMDQREYRSFQPVVASLDQNKETVS